MSGKTKTTEVQTNDTPTEAQAAQVEQQVDTPATTPTAAVNAGQTPVVEKVFTQAELNAVIAQRLQQERAKFADYDSLRQQVATLQGAQQTEAQRAQTLEQQNQQLATKAKETSVEVAIAKEASKIGLDAEAAFKLADQTKLQLDEKGNVTNAAEIVKAVADQYPGLLKRPMPVASAVNQAANGQSVTPEQERKRQMSDYFGGNAGSFWSGGGVRLPMNLDN
jgi:hypothetical protein